MARKPKKAKRARPKVRKTWGINPKTRVKDSAKKYHRKKEKQKARDWVKEVDWFGSWTKK